VTAAPMPIKSLALIGSAWAESADKREEVQCRGAFDKGDLKEAAGGADEYGASNVFWYRTRFPAMLLSTATSCRNGFG
jgi:hypothetical protein